MKMYKKIFFMFLIAVFSLSFSALTPNANATASSGTLIKMTGNSSVYYLGDDGRRYVFPNETTYFSWYDNFDNVLTIPQSEMEQYSLGANVTMRPGTWLVKIKTDPKVYAVEPGGVLRWITTETVAKALYGDNWNKRIVDVSDAFFSNYIVGANPLNTSVYPAGTLVKYAGAETYYIIGVDGKARKLANDAALQANRYNKKYAVNSSLAKPELGSEIKGMETSLSNTAERAGTVANVDLGVKLASDNPSAKNIPASSPVDFLKLTFTAPKTGAVNITSIKLTSYKLGNSENIDNVSFYDGTTRVGSPKNFSSDRTATFNFQAPLSIPAGAVKSYLVKATIAAGKSGEYALGIAKSADITTSAASISGTFPLVGNSQSVVSGVSIGTVTLASVEHDNVTVKLGDDSVLLASFKLDTANEPIILQSLRLKSAGTNKDGVANNLKLYIDDEEAARTGNIVNKYVSFNNINYLIPKNKTVDIKVYGDIGAAAVNNTIDLYIDNSSDIVFVGQQFGYNIQLASISALDASNEGITVSVTTGDFTLDMDKSALPTKELQIGEKNAVLAVIRMTSNSEDAVIESMTDKGNGEFVITGLGLECQEISNTVLVDTATGNIYDISVTNSAPNTCALSLQEDVYLLKGITKVFQLKTKLLGPNDVNSIDNGDQMKVVMKAGALTVKGETTKRNITDITPGTIIGSVITVKASSLNWSTTYLTDKTVVMGANDVLVYQASLKSGNASQVTLTSVKLDVITGNGFRDNNIASLSLYLDGKLLVTKTNNIVNDGMDSAYIVFNNLNTANSVIPAGTAMDLTVKANFNTSFSVSGSFSLGLENASDSVVAKDKSNNNVEESIVNINDYSRTINLETKGTAKAELNTIDISIKDSYLLAGTETVKGKYMGEIKMYAAYEPIKVTSLALERAVGANATNRDIALVKLYDKSGSAVAEGVPNANGNVLFSNLNLVLPADQFTQLYIGIKTKSINGAGDQTGTATFNRIAKFNLAGSEALSDLRMASAIKAEGMISGVDIAMTEAVGAEVGSNEYSNAVLINTKSVNITGALLSSITGSMANGDLGGGTSVVVGKYKLAFSAGTNRYVDNEDMKAQLKQLVLTFYTSQVDATNIRAYIEGKASVKTTAVSLDGSKKATIDLTTLSGTTGYVNSDVILVITADINNLGSNAVLQTKIANTSTDFTYNGNSGNGTDYSDSRLDETEIVGAKLIN